jgi:MinD-like ATPase involved in chromosome partitioning or flagellar assembly
VQSPEKPPRPPVPSTPPERPDPARLVGKIAPGDSTARRVWQVASRMLTSSRDSRELPELVTAVQLPVTTGRRIAITSVRGGAGKSAVAALLGIVYAARRFDAVLAADADPDGGSLAWRLGLSGTSTMSDLAPRLLAARGGELSGLDQLLPRTRTGLWVLPGGAPDQPRLARDVTRALSRLFAVCVTDCGRGMDSPATVQVLSEAHAVVVVAPATPDGVRTTCDALDRVASTDRSASLSRVVVALSAHTAEGKAALRASAAREAFARYDVPVVVLPYDRHLAAAAAITPSQIGHATLVEATRLAGRALARAGPL